MDGISFEAGVNVWGNILTCRFVFTALKCELYKESSVGSSPFWTSGVSFWDLSLLMGLLMAVVLVIPGDAPFLREAAKPECTTDREEV